MTTNREGIEETEQVEENFEVANEVLTPAAEIGEVIATASTEMENALTDAKEEIKSVESGLEYQSLTEVRDKFGTLISKLGSGTGFHAESFDPYFMIISTSKGSRGDEGGAFIDLNLEPKQAKDLLESLGRIMEDIDGITETPAAEGAPREKRYMGEKTELSKARDEFGTLKVSKISANVFEDYKGLGPKVVLLTTSEGKRGPKGTAPIDMAISIDDAKKLFAILTESKADIEKNVVEEED